MVLFWRDWLVGGADGPEDENVAVDDDEQWQEEDKDEEQHGVGSHWWREGHVVPRAGGQQALGDIGTWWGEKVVCQPQPAAPHWPTVVRHGTAGSSYNSNRRFTDSDVFVFCTLSVYVVIAVFNKFQTNKQTN